MSQLEEQENWVNELEPFQRMASSTKIDMAKYFMMDPSEARSLLPREIWKGVLREGMMVILGGESKAKKSWLSLSLAMAAVASVEFLGNSISPPLEGIRRVRVLDFELMEENIMSRFLAMSERFDDDESSHAIWNQIDIYQHRMIEDAKDWIKYVAMHCEQMNRGDFLIVDCLQALDIGDHNDQGVIRAHLKRLQSVATRMGVCILIVDHFNKSSEAKGKNRISGSIAKAATPDAIILLESDGAFIKLSFELRMDPARDSITLAFDSPSEGFRVVTEEEKADRKEATDNKKREERIALMFPDRSGRYTKAEIATNIARSPDTAVVWIKEFMGVIETHTPGGKSPNLYSLKKDA
jgi:archaellum biogenesis ATPase FlaH